MRLLNASLVAALAIGAIAVPSALAVAAHGPGDHGATGTASTSGDAARTTAAPLTGGLAALTTGAGASWRVTCRFSHAAMDDPIVYPGQPGKSHDHAFVGNTSTNAATTATTLLAAPTTCDDRADRSAYWMPALIVDGTTVNPTRGTATYRRATAAPVTAFPAGLKVVAGESHAMAAQPLSVVSWSCGPRAGVAASPTPPACPDTAGSGLRLQVTFPSCWDGKNLDTDDHRSHLAYLVSGACPATHPVVVPQLVLEFAYPTRGGTTVALGSGGALTGHADFINAWRPGSLERLVARLNGTGDDGRQGPPRGQGEQRGQGGPQGPGGPGQDGGRQRGPQRPGRGQGPAGDRPQGPLQGQGQGPLGRPAAA